MEGFYWAAGIIVLIVGFLANYGAAVDTLYKMFGKNKAQPKLAISMTFNNRGRNVRDNKVYYPFEYKEGDVIPFDRIKELAYVYYFDWNYEMSITNQAEAAAIDVRVGQIKGAVTGFHLEDILDRTVPFVFGVSKLIKVKFTRIYRCTDEEATELLAKKPFEKLYLTYSNLDGKRYYTEYSMTDGEAVNRFLRVRKEYSILGFKFNL